METRWDMADMNPGDQHSEVVKDQNLPSASGPEPSASAPEPSASVSAPDDGEGRSPEEPEQQPTAVLGRAASREGAGGHGVSKWALASAVVASATLLAVTLVSVGGIGGSRSGHLDGAVTEPGPGPTPSQTATGAAPAPTPAASSATATPSKSASASPSRSRHRTPSDHRTPADHPDRTSAAHAKTTSTASSPKPVSENPTVRPSSYLSADVAVDPGSNPYWAQNDVDVDSTVPLSDLRVDVRVAQTGGVASTGTWTSLGSQVDVTVTDVGDAIDYVFKLKQGVILPAGRYYFEVQYNHAQGARDAEYDAYDVTAVDSGPGAMEDVRGHFG